MRKILNAIATFRNRHRRCVCGALDMPGVGAYTTQLANVLHRVDGPCYLCDTRGRPL